MAINFYSYQCQRCGQFQNRKLEAFSCDVCKRNICKKCAQGNVCFDCINEWPPQIAEQYIKASKSARKLYWFSGALLLLGFPGLGIIYELLDGSIPIFDAYVFQAMGLFVIIGLCGLISFNIRFLRLSRNYLKKYPIQLQSPSLPGSLNSSSGTTIPNSTAQVTCPHCHQARIGNAPECSNCGYDFLALESALAKASLEETTKPNTSQRNGSQQIQIVCPRCKTPVTPTTEICPKCKKIIDVKPISKFH